MEMKNIYFDNENKKQFSSLNKHYVYLDNGATTKVDEKVMQEMLPFFMENFGNASSLHTYGVVADEALKNSRHTIAESLNADDEGIIFTSGGTESNNLALKGIAWSYRNKGKHIITTKIEHDCILNTAKWLSTQGFEVTYLNVDKDGLINLDELKNAIRKDTILVSVIHGNNEVGTIQDIESIGNICRERNVFFHTDACQSFTKVPIDVKKINIDLITINAHKIHGPKGVGALYIRKGVEITPTMHGGGHEFKLRSGTSNVSGIVGFAKAAQLGMKDLKKNSESMTKLRDYAITELLKIKNTSLNGAKGGMRLPNNVNITFGFIEGEAILMHLDMMGVAVSTGSACSSKSLKPSHVLTAMGRAPEEAHGSIRITLSKYTTKKELDYAIKSLKKVVETLRKLSPLMPAKMETKKG